MGKLIIGADECGYGPLAGPMVICAACAGEDMHKMHARDSKKYGKNVNRLWSDIRQSSKFSLGYGMCIIDADTVTRMGYNRSREYGFNQCVAKLRKRLAPRYPRAIIDGQDSFFVPFSVPIVKADDKYKVVSYASCLAKVNQIESMHRIHDLYPEFGFNEHHGYGTPQHLLALREHGPVPGIHRMNVVIKMFKRKGWTLREYRRKVSS